MPPAAMPLSPGASGIRGDGGGRSFPARRPARRPGRHLCRQRQLRSFDRSASPPRDRAGRPGRRSRAREGGTLVDRAAAPDCRTRASARRPKPVVCHPDRSQPQWAAAPPGAQRKSLRPTASRVARAHASHRRLVYRGACVACRGAPPRAHRPRQAAAAGHRKRAGGCKRWVGEIGRDWPWRCRLAAVATRRAHPRAAAAAAAQPPPGAQARPRPDERLNPPRGAGSKRAVRPRHCSERCSEHFHSRRRARGSRHPARRAAANHDAADASRAAGARGPQPWRRPLHERGTRLMRADAASEAPASRIAAAACSLPRTPPTRGSRSS